MPSAPVGSGTAASVLTLRFIDGSVAGSLMRIHVPEALIGRRRECQIRLDPQLDSLVSGRHARLFYAEGAWWIEDVGSRNGTWVNGRELDRPARLAHDDEVVLGRDGKRGSVSFTVRLGAATTATTFNAEQPRT